MLASGALVLRSGGHSPGLPHTVSHIAFVFDRTGITQVDQVRVGAFNQSWLPPKGRLLVGWPYGFLRAV